MRTSLWVKLAASSMIVGGLTVAQNAYADFSPKGAAVASREAARMAARAEKLLAKDTAKALVAAEHAVALAPTDADHRMLLGRAYLANGRFRSAATSFSDVLALDPSRGNAALSLALAKIALGDKDGARALVDEHQQRIAPSDRGLALALTGDAPGGVGVLEAVVRGGGSDAKTRQNLALAYALAGRWLEAKLMASYDLDAATVSKRIMDWSKLAREDAGATHVAALLGVQPTATDEGMPVRLALAPAAPEAAPVRMAEAAPPPPPARLAEPVEVAQAPAIAAPVDEAPRPSVSFAAPSEVVQQPRVLPVVPRYEGPQPKPAAYVVPAKGGRFAVQIGAFSTPGRVEAAWSQTVSRVGSLARFTPASATVRTAGGTFYRLSVTGFETRDSAVRLCMQLRARGGQCFVREVAGDAPLQWAANRGPRIASR
jgi:Tfp pilus assembly protein PilF